MYDADAHCKGYKDNKVALIQPKRMEWDLDKECRITIAEAVSANKKLCDDLDLRIMEHKAWGKGFIKKSRISPDAFFQLAMQLAYKRDSGGKRALTYEASVTRLFAQVRDVLLRWLLVGGNVSELARERVVCSRILTCGKTLTPLAAASRASRGGRASARAALKALLTPAIKSS
jgi:carnitine O-palmitoyltransferase 1